MKTKNLTIVLLILGSCITSSLAGAEEPRASLKANSGVKADDSAKNVRDRNDNTALTADDQSMTDGNQTKVLGALRRAVLDIPNLSINGQNIKIMVDNKTVTLRGPVVSNEERSTIENTVKKTAPALSVNNLLEIAK